MAKATKKQTFSMGDSSTDETLGAAGAGDNRLKLQNADGENIFLIISPDFQIRNEHWIKTEEENLGPVLCAVHGSDDLKIIAAGRNPDLCAACQRSRELYDFAKKLSKKDDLREDIMKISSDIGVRTNYEFLAVAGIAEKRVLKGEIVISNPQFKNLSNVGILPLSEATFQLFRESFERAGLEQKDLIGMPINFHRGMKKNQKSKFSSVVRIDFFPKNKPAKLPKTLPEFEPMEYDPEVMENLLNEWDEGYADTLAQIRGGKRSAAKPAAKKAAKRK